MHPLLKQMLGEDLAAAHTDLKSCLNQFVNLKVVDADILPPLPVTHRGPEGQVVPWIDVASKVLRGRLVGIDTDGIWIEPGPQIVLRANDLIKDEEVWHVFIQFRQIDSILVQALKNLPPDSPAQPERPIGLRPRS